MSAVKHGKLSLQLDVFETSCKLPKLQLGYLSSQFAQVWQSDLGAPRGAPAVHSHGPRGPRMDLQ